MGEHEFKGAEIIGYDEAEGGYFTRMFDNGSAGRRVNESMSQDRLFAVLPGLQPT